MHVSSSSLLAAKPPSARAALRAEVARWAEPEKRRYAPLFSRLTERQAQDILTAKLGTRLPLQKLLSDIFTPAVGGPIDQFQQTLRSIYPAGMDPSLLRCLLAHAPARLSQADDEAKALDLVSEAMCFPDPDVENEWEKQYGYVLAGPFLPDSDAHSILLRIFEGSKPRLLKVLPASVDPPLANWAAMPQSPSVPLVPLLRTLCFPPMVPLTNSPPCCHGAVMPLYAGDAAALWCGTHPSPHALLSLVQRMIAALAALHSEGLCHCNVLPEHILLTFTGLPFLGGLGSLRYMGDPLPGHCSHLGLATALPLLDLHQLAATVLVIEGTLTALQAAGQTVATVQQRLEGDGREEWKALLLSAIRDAHSRHRDQPMFPIPSLRSVS